MSLTQTIVQLHLACSNLRNRDFTSKSDPQIVVFQYNLVSPSTPATFSHTRLPTFLGNFFGKTDPARWNEIGRTEVLKDQLSPKFTTKIQLPYIFEENQLLRFIVLDVDNSSKDITEQDLLGIFETSLAAIVAAPSGSLTATLSDAKKKDSGKISIAAIEVSEAKMIARLKFAGRKLDKKDFFGKSDPYFVISKGVAPATFAVYKSEVIKKTLDPDWRLFEIPLNDLCGNDLSAPLLIEIFDEDVGREEPEFIGSTTVTVANLVERHGEIPVMNAKRTKKPIAGYLRIVEASLIKIPSFLDYIAGGTEINLKVAIDFTGSNGSPHSFSSLHYISPHYNNYQKAILGVGQILENYDTDKMFTVTGFGASFYRKPVSHYFNLTGDDHVTTVHGVGGILETYAAAIPNLQFSGPTNFAPTINATLSQLNPHENKYTFLLILTDGEISDMQATVNAIVNASEMPISIVIVGIGNSTFENMNILDADTEPLKNSVGKYASRDCVQFVPFNSFANSEIGKELLAKEVLAEIPSQIVKYFRSKNISPGPPRVTKAHQDSNNGKVPQDSNGKENEFFDVPPAYGASGSGSK